ncbi:hypothetical protein HPB47_021026, partial [Ixodes persulcatus]
MPYSHASCSLANQEERLCILQALSRKLLLADDVDLASVARRTDHFSGADLQALLYTSQLEVVHEVFPEKERSNKGRRLDGSSSSEEPGSVSDTGLLLRPGSRRPVPNPGSGTESATGARGGGADGEPAGSRRPPATASALEARQHGPGAHHLPAAPGRSPDQDAGFGLRLREGQVRRHICFVPVRHIAYRTATVGRTT